MKLRPVITNNTTYLEQSFKFVMKDNSCNTNIIAANQRQSIICNYLQITVWRWHKWLIIDEGACGIRMKDTWHWKVMPLSAILTWSIFTPKAKKIHLTACLYASGMWCHLWFKNLLVLAICCAKYLVNLDCYDKLWDHDFAEYKKIAITLHRAFQSILVTLTGDINFS